MKKFFPLESKAKSQDNESNNTERTDNKVESKLVSTNFVAKAPMKGKSKTKVKIDK